MTDFMHDQIAHPSIEPKITTLLELSATNEGVAEYLLNTIDLVGKYFDTTDAIPAIMELCESWLNDVRVDLNDTQSKNHVCAMLRLTTFLTQLRSNYETLQIESRQ